jgi:hypothetical protein
MEVNATQSIKVSLDEAEVKKIAVSKIRTVVGWGPRTYVSLGGFVINEKIFHGSHSWTETTKTVASPLEIAAQAMIDAILTS